MTARTKILYRDNACGMQHVPEIGARLTHLRGSQYLNRIVQNSRLGVVTRERNRQAWMSSNRVVASRRVPLEPQLAPAIPPTENAEAARFRPEIAALRAVAVLGVVLCHLKITPFDGGFVGVDIFFVISGYLISRNTLLDVRQHRFSFTNFYIRRSRRILPALIFTVVVTFVVGALWLPPDAFRQLAKKSTHALLSISNIQYWRELKQYFAAASDQLALLHCWSLSLEEQFYLFWPALLFWAFRLGPDRYYYLSDGKRIVYPLDIGAQ